MKSVVRRLGMAVAAVALTAGGAVAIGSPAQADPPACGISKGYYVDGAQNIIAWHWRVCDNGTVTPRYVSIERLVYSGVYTTVASGYGDVNYYCNGHGLNIYHVFSNPDFYNTCG